MYDGCSSPDSDNDGIKDDEDACPNVSGLVKYKGCPVPDTDGDKINDEDDKCPAEPGVARYSGCPVGDTDSDGVNDDDDKCPDQPGTPSNNGCPEKKVEIQAEVRQKVEKAAHNIFFATGSAQLLAKSFPSLNEVVKVLKADPTINLEINGHTDITGTANKNLILSKSRANAVLSYLKKKGIAAGRMTANGFGQTQPIADNKTVSGRAKNRRVELKLSN